MSASPMTADEVEGLAATRLAPFISIGGPSRVERGLLKEIAGAGLLAPFFPERFGGAAADPISAARLCASREGLARISTEASTALAIQIGGSYVAVLHGTDEARDEWLPAVVRGELVAAVALTEPQVGSDLAAMAMPATRTPGGWLLSGSKTWIMKAPEADLYTVFARTSGSSGAHGITAFLVPGASKGLTGSPIETLWPDRVGRLQFDAVFVPDHCVIGEIGEGFGIGMSIFELFRPSVGAHVVGFAKAALDATITYAKERQAFGRSIGGFQAVSHQLAEMAVRLEAARLLVYHAAETFDSVQDVRIKRSTSSMAKLFATEAGQYILDAALQIHGAAGLERGHLIEHLYREARAARIYEGTSEIQREIIARVLLAD